MFLFLAGVAEVKIKKADLSTTGSGTARLVVAEGEAGFCAALACFNLQ
jgi:hypothetical protein